MRLFFSFLVMAFLVLQGCNASELQNENIYVSPSNVLIGENGIFVKYDETILAVPSIGCDANGIYFNAYMRASDGDRDNSSWYCDNCGSRNSDMQNTCRECGKPKTYYSRDSGPSIGY